MIVPTPKSGRRGNIRAPSTPQGRAGGRDKFSPNKAAQLGPHRLAELNRVHVRNGDGAILSKRKLPPASAQI